MKWIGPVLLCLLMLASSGCAETSSMRATPSPNLGVSMMHTPGGSGSLSYPTSIYDPALLNDPSMIEDQWRHDDM
jgi:hypothetical protein